MKFIHYDLQPNFFSSGLFSLAEPGSNDCQRWAAQHVSQVRNTQFHSFVIIGRKTQLRSVSKFASALCAIPQLRILPQRTITVRKKKLQNKKMRAPHSVDGGGGKGCNMGVATAE
jgi:hypothetical protein